MSSKFKMNIMISECSLRTGANNRLQGNFSPTRIKHFVTTYAKNLENRFGCEQCFPLEQLHYVHFAHAYPLGSEFIILDG